MSITSWSRDGEPSVAEAESKRLLEEVRKEKLLSRVTGSLPLDRDRAAFELTEEERVRRNSRPRTRRWRGLGKLDDKVDQLAHRSAEATAKLSEAEQLLQRAPQDDAKTLATWLANGEKGDRPVATVYERQRARDAAQLLVHAVAVEYDNALAERLAYVERHRGRMLEDARRDVAEARDKLREHVRGLPELRDALLGARGTLEWAATFPAMAETYGFESAAALGLRKPIQTTLHTTARVEYRDLLAALEADADALADQYAETVKEKLGTAEPPSPLRKAMWDSDPDAVAWKKAELERARQLAEWHDPNKLAREIRD